MSRAVDLSSMQVEMAEYSLTSKYSESQEYFQHRRNLDLSPHGE